jgi:shikimate dehydrogenase
MTRRYALAGYPVAHSPSPAMHNAAFAAVGLEAHYRLRPTRADQAHEVIAELRDGRWDGLNVTTPLKTIVASGVQLDAVASRAGAVNTVWRQGPHLCGALTDVDGVREPLLAAGVKSGAEALVIGSGGAARAAIVALDQMGATAHVAARSTEKAVSALNALRPRGAGQTLSLDDQSALAALFPSLEVIIQATPVGRAGDAHPLPWPCAAPRLVAFEMVYLPERTPFAVQASEAGGSVIEGWQMLLEQGVRAFELWTGQPAPRDVMRQALRQHIMQETKSPSVPRDK